MIAYHGPFAELRLLGLAIYVAMLGCACVVHLAWGRMPLDRRAVVHGISRRFVLTWSAWLVAWEWLLLHSALLRWLPPVGLPPEVRSAAWLYSLCHVALVAAIVVSGMPVMAAALRRQAVWELAERGWRREMSRPVRTVTVTALGPLIVWTGVLYLSLAHGL